MEFDVALRLAAFFVGAFLHGILVFGVLGRGESRPSERVLRLFFVALFLWHAGSLLGLSLRNAAGPGASLVRRLAHAGAFSGLAFMPVFLIHSVVSEGRDRLGRRLGRWDRLLLGAVYAPLVGLGWPLYQILRPPERAPLVAVKQLIVPWNLWFVLVLIAAAWLATWIGRQDPDDTRRVHVRLSATFVPIAAGLFYAYVLDGRNGPYGYHVETAVMASSILPTLTFVYYVYRYRVLGYVVRDRAVSLLASGSLVAFYLFFVRQAARRGESMLGIPAMFLDGAVLVVMVLLFEPYGATLRSLVRRYVGGGRERLRRRAALCASRLAGARSVDDITDALKSSLQTPDGVARVQLLLAEDVPTGSPDVWRLDHKAPLLSAELASGVRLVRRDLAASAALVTELDALAAHAALALRSQDTLHGALLVRAHDELTLDELEVLDVVAQGAALALQAAALLTEKVAAERKAAHSDKMASLGWLAASVAHEVKNPLSSIKAIAQVMADEAGPGHRFGEDARTIVAQTDRLRDVVERLLATARPDPAGARAPGPTALGAALDRMTVALEPQARARGVRFEVELQAGAARIAAGEDALWEVLYNLAANGIDAMPDGGTLRFQQLERDDGLVLLRVSDDGPGIADEVADRIFEPFFTTRPSGHGLGLAIVRRRLRAIGGDVELNRAAAPGAGAVFDVDLPVAPDDGNPRRSASGQ